jgi:hypothetical protein
MSRLHPIYQLLREEYALSRHIWWLDEDSGKLVNDVTYCLLLIRRAAECIRRGEEDCWRELVTYALERSMSYLLMYTIGEYLAEWADLPPLPTVDLTEKSYRNWRGTEVPLLDETDHAPLHGCLGKPETDRVLNLKGQHQWSIQPMRLHDEHPLPMTQTVSKSQHWLF